MTPVPASGGTSVGAYTKGKFLSKGAFGQAFLAKCKGSHKEFVIKMVDISCCDHKERESARKECTILSRLKHPNIIEYRESFEEKGQLCIVMAYADGGDLSARLKAQGGKLLNEDQIADWFVQICLALKHLHDRKILHRDLKSQNIFLTGRKQMIKLGDFGIARVLKHTNEHARTAIGTPYYLSPEICEGKPYNNKSDVWSLGIVLYELCTLKCPFDANNLNGLILKIIRGVYAPVPANLSQPLRSLVSLLLTRVPCSRPNINELLRMRYIKDRIGFFLDESLRKEEFSHTVLHSSTSQPAASAPAPDVASKRPSPSQGVQPIHKPVEPAKPAHHAAAKDPLPKTPAPKTGRREAPAPAAAPRKHGGMLKDAKHPSVVKADAKAVSKTASDAEAASAIWSKLVGGEGDNGGRAERPALGVGMGGKNRPRVGLLEKMVKDRERERVERVQREMEREREATQQRMNRGANAVGRLQGRGDLKGEVMFLEQKKREEAHARAAAAREKRELMRQDMIRMRDLYRQRVREDKNKEKEELKRWEARGVEKEREGGGGVIAATDGARETNGVDVSTGQPTGVHIFTNCLEAQGVGEGAKTLDEVKRDVGKGGELSVLVSGVGGGRGREDTGVGRGQGLRGGVGKPGEGEPGEERKAGVGEGWMGEPGEERKAGVIAAGQRAKARERLEEEEALRLARIEAFEDRKQAMQRARQHQQEVFATPSSATAQDDRTCSHRTVEEGQAKEEEEEQEEEDEEGSRAGQRCPHRAETLGTGGKLVVTTGDFDGTGTEAHGIGTAGRLEMGCAVSEEEADAEGEEDFGAMLGELTSLLSRCEDEESMGNFTPVNVNVKSSNKNEKKNSQQESREEEEEEGTGGEEEEGEVGKTSPVVLRERIEELRLLLEEGIGAERLRMAYSYMTVVRRGDDDEILSEKIAELMGEGFQAFFPSLIQLLACEQSAYDPMQARH